MPTAWEMPGFAFSLPSAADYSADSGYAYTFVDVNSSGKGVRVSTLGADGIGVKQNKPRLDEAMAIVHNGVSFAVASAAITAGAYVSVAATGKVKTAATGERTVGRALVGAGGADELISLLIFGRPVLAP